VVPQDSGMPESVTAQRAMVIRDPEARASRRIYQLATELLQLAPPEGGVDRLDEYWVEYLNYMRTGGDAKDSRSSPSVQQGGNGPAAPEAQPAPAVAAAASGSAEVAALRSELMPMLNELVQSNIRVFDELRQIRERLDAGLELSTVDESILQEIIAPLAEASPVVELPARRPEQRTWVRREKPPACEAPKLLERLLGAYELTCEQVDMEQTSMELFTFTRHSGQRLTCSYHAQEDDSISDPETSRARHS
jgi:hypothetical protein